MSVRRVKFGQLNCRGERHDVRGPVPIGVNRRFCSRDFLSFFLFIFFAETRFVETRQLAMRPTFAALKGRSAWKGMFVPSSYRYKVR